MHQLTFYNLGSADCIQIDLDNGKRLMFDYANTRDPDDKEDLRCNLPDEIRSRLDGADSFDVVAFTHLDRDHYVGATEFFYFEHIAKYQEDVDGEPRIKMTEMWVPSAIITESLSRDASTEAKAIQKEARKRFKAKSQIRVFSRPERLADWCEQQDIDLEERHGLITDAGQIIPGFELSEDAIELFAHSPFAVRQNDQPTEDRNADSLVVHATFEVDGETTKLFLGGDCECEPLADIVHITEKKGNTARLEWDIFKLPHHCSHHSLSQEERKGDKTAPHEDVGRLYEEYGNEGCIIVSTSNAIPTKGSDGDKKGANPPHRQAANYFKEDVVADEDDFKVTMEHPNKSSPKPLEIKIDGKGVTVRKLRVAATAVATASRAPRAG